MSTLLLKLAGPMQAWGDSSRHTRRETRQEPTKSGVLGLLASAQGRRRTDPIEDLARLRFGVRVDQPGVLTRDFHTAIRWRDGVSMPLSYRYYLADAVFVAAVEGDGELIESLADALRRPTFPLYLGRRACPTSEPVFLDVVEESLEESLTKAPWAASDWHRKQLGRHVSLLAYMDAAAGCAGEAVHDVPLSFNPERRAYGWRNVAEFSVRQDNPDGHDEMDFMSLLGG
ncbi:type I-E CRISPR-associated protein Cas5/CasD [Dermacoccus barathri]|uniref:Type I-E CRISPR-associated protein Cas5/CasD n=1 Tax=Dermacoccus barathri TaxID=322601 RepID=A0ABN2B436_9MICO